MECVAEYDARPELREVAMKFFSGDLRTTDVAVASQTPTTINQPLSLEDCYSLLGVDHASENDEKALADAYRKKARELHPDNPKSGDSMKFYQLTRAYSAIRGGER